MEEVKVFIETEEDVILPAYGSDLASGMDVRVHLTADKIDKMSPVPKSRCDILTDVFTRVVLMPGERFIFPTGIKVAIPEGYEIQVRPRSGLAAKNGITVLNTPGTIDADYRGEIGVIVINNGKHPQHIYNRDRIAQLVLAPVIKCKWEVVGALPVTERGEGGFGSTGI